MGSSSQHVSLKWNNHLKHMTSAFDSLRIDEEFVDVTLSCEGKKIRAHKMLLSASSLYFKELFKENPCQHPVIVFRDFKLRDLEAIITFIYHGEVNVPQDHLLSFLSVAELLCIQGLNRHCIQSNEHIGPQDRLKTDTMDEEFVERACDGSNQMTRDSNTTSAPANVPKIESEFEPLPFSSQGPKRRKCNNSDANIKEENDNGNEDLLVQCEAKLKRFDCEELSSSTYCLPQISSELIDTNKILLQEKLPKTDELDYYKQFSDNDMHNVGGYGTDKPYACPLCGICYKHKTNLYGHMKFHTGETMCSICHRMLSTKQKLQQHMVLVHSCKLKLCN